MPGLLLFIGALAIGLCGSVIAVGLRLSRPARTLIGSPPDVLSEAETITLRSGSGALVRGWWLSARRPGGGGAVVLMHGAWTNRLRWRGAPRFCATMVSRCCCSISRPMGRAAESALPMVGGSRSMPQPPLSSFGKGCRGSESA